MINNIGADLEFDCNDQKNVMEQEINKELEEEPKIPKRRLKIVESYNFHGEPINEKI